MKGISLSAEALRQFAAALLCLLAVILIPEGIGAKTGLLVKAEAATSKTLVVGQTGTLSLPVSCTVKWKSSKPTVLKITQKGNLQLLRRENPRLPRG